MKKILFIIIAIFGLTISSAKEPTNIMIGIGGGYGMTSLDIKHSHIMRYPIWDRDYTKPNWAGKPAWASSSNMSLSSWSGSWEILAGYKHFVNDYLGVRAYGVVGVQHYKPSLYKSNNDPIGIIDYSINTDVLINFYESNSFSVGILAGLGFGGASFAKNAVDKYMVVYSRDNGVPVGNADISKHFFNINANAGFRLTYFQKVKRISERTCEDTYTNGKRICKVPYHYVDHSLEFNARFNTLPYKATKSPEIAVVNGTTVSVPQYTVKNPYRLQLDTL